MNKLNTLKYNLNTLSVLQLNGRSIIKNFYNVKLLLNLYIINVILFQYVKLGSMNLILIYLNYRDIHRTIINHKKSWWRLYL